MTPSSNGRRAEEPLVDLRAAQVHFTTKRGEGLLRRRTVVRAVDGVELAVGAGRTVGLVGESGSGKSTLGRLAVRLLEPTGGTVRFDGRDISHAKRSELRGLRRDLQMVFQDPYSSLNPRALVGDSVAEPLRTHLRLDRRARTERTMELVSLVGLPAQHLERYPRELSGGQLQRLSIARALALHPRFVVLDEPVSALDVSTQAQVINLLGQLQRDLSLAYLLIAHNPALVHYVSDEIAVMYLGRIVEHGPASLVYRQPKHPYTRALLSAVPVPNPVVQRERQRIVLTGDVPDPSAVPAGCRFHTRCPWAMDVCLTEDPGPFVAIDGVRVHCHLHTTGPVLAGDTVLRLPTPSRPGRDGAEVATSAL